MPLGSETPESESARSWGAEILDAPPDGAPTEMTGAFLRRLGEEDFVPPAILRTAWEAAARDGNEHRSRAFDAFRENRLSVEIEQFAAQFFALGFVERLERWQRLFSQSEVFPRCLVRMESLQSGLKIGFDRSPPLEPDVALLAKFVAEIFVLRPAQRAVRRREIMRSELTEDDARWRRAAQKLQKQLPAVAALAPELTELLVSWRKTAKIAKNNRRKRLARPPIKTSSKTGGSRSGALIAVVVVAAISGVFRDMFSTNSNRQTPSPNYFNSPAYAPDPGKGFGSKSAAEVISDLIRKRNEKAQRPNQEIEQPQSRSPRDVSDTMPLPLELPPSRIAKPRSFPDIPHPQSPSNPSPLYPDR